MDQGVYESEARLEATHWWFVGRRKLFTRFIRAMGLDPDAPILDVGTSTGTNLRMLREMGFSNVTGLDTSPDAIRFCHAKGFGPVRRGSITAMPFASETFSLVLATDIIEHVDDDGAALAELSRVVKKHGHVLITVPAFPSLWGFQDDASHHKRRYRLATIVDMVRASRLQPLQTFHFNFLLFGPIWLARQLMKVVKPSIKSENDLNTPFVNTLLGGIFGLDLRTASRLKPPFGVSIFVLAAKAPP